ncbi:MAG: radical SAM-associated putative lipoprotein [Paludibacter sp.]|jgi:putative lipoprotein (rSAM/lipoprotein system)
MKIFKYSILLVIVCIGFITACNDNKNNLAYYQLNGIVTDSLTTNPLKKIRIIREGTDYLLYSDTTYTDSIGKYHFELTDYYAKNATFSIKVEDVDGESNGGDYVTRKLNVIFSKSDWINIATDSEYYGTASKNFDIKLQKK